MAEFAGSSPLDRATVWLLFTEFPRRSEVFLQREVRALRAAGAAVRVVSLWGGAETWDGAPVDRFRRRRLWTVLWRLPAELWRDPGVLGDALRAAWRFRVPNWTNFWENLLGAGWALCHAPEARRQAPAHVHAVWASAPAAAAWMLRRLTGHDYSLGAHAYDIYEDGGDWFLDAKIADASFVRTSTAMARDTLVGRGVDPARIALIRRGLDRLPPLHPLRPGRHPLRLLCVARLVEKKGLERQLELHAAARAAGLACEVRWLGDGPLRARLERRIAELGLGEVVRLDGHVPESAVFEALAWADALVHTGVVAPSGDRDGLPNAVPEAMAAGAVVTTAPAPGVMEAVNDGDTGVVLPLGDAAAWVAAWRRIATEDAWCERLRRGARAWVEANFDAHRNVARLRRCWAAGSVVP